MSNRHARRIEERSFRIAAHRSFLITHLVAADDASVDAVPLLQRAKSYWNGQIATRRPYCTGCDTNFADDAQPALFLFACLPSDPDVVSVSAICAECHRDLSESEIEAACGRVLQRLLPGGRFLDARAA